MIKKIEKLVNEAEKHIADLNLELPSSLQEEYNKIQNEYFTKFIEAKSELRKVRQSLRLLADQIIKDTQFLELIINSMEKYEGPFWVKLLLQKMSKLLESSEKTLIEARGKYNMAIKTFDTLNHAIQNRNIHTRKVFKKNSLTFVIFPIFH